MLFLVKSVVSMGCLGAALYGVFFVDVGGQPLATHAREIWSSELVQHKVEKIRGDVRQNLEERLERSKARGGGEQPTRHEISDADRRALEALLEPTSPERPRSAAR